MIYDIQTPTWILHTPSLQVKNGLTLIFCLFHTTYRRGRFWSKNRTDAKRCREISTERIDLPFVAPFIAATGASWPEKFGRNIKIM